MGRALAIALLTTVDGSGNAATYLIDSATSQGLSACRDNGSHSACIAYLSLFNNLFSSAQPGNVVDFGNPMLGFNLFCASDPKLPAGAMCSVVQTQASDVQVAFDPAADIADIVPSAIAKPCDPSALAAGNSLTFPTAFLTGISQFNILGVGTLATLGPTGMLQECNRRP